MAPPQASPHPWWPLSLVCHLLVWSLQYIIYTWSWHQVSEGQQYHCISCGSNCNNPHRKWNSCRRPKTHATAVFPRLLKHIELWPRYQTIVFAHFDPKFLSFHAGFPEISFSGNSSSDSLMMNKSSAYRFSNGHLVWNSCKRVSRTTMNSKGLRQELWWMPAFLTFNSRDFQHFRYGQGCTRSLATFHQQ